MKGNAIRMANRAFLLRILLPVSLTLVLFVVALFQIIIPRFEEVILDRKREMILELTSSAWSGAQHFHRQELLGRLTRQEAQGRAIEQLGNLRYGDEGKDYFWITDYEPRMIYHPFREDLNGRSLVDFRDSRGKKLFVEIVNVVRKQGEGYVDYTWQWKDDSTRIVPKLSFVKTFEPWGWIIGTGIYLEDVKAEIASLEKSVVNISIFITIATSLLLIFIAAQNLKSERKRIQAEERLRESKEKYEALAETTTEGLLMILDDGELHYNKSLLAMLGYPETEAGKLSLPDLFQNHGFVDAGELRNPETLIGKIDAHAEVRLKRGDGTFMDSLLTASPIDLLGRKGVVIIVKDIGHHKQMAEALVESRERFLSLTNRLSIAVFRTEAEKDMKILEANAAAARLFGFRSPDLLTGTTFSERFDNPHAFKSCQDELNASGRLANRKIPMKKSDNSDLTVALSMALIRDDEGNTAFCDCLAEDITEPARKVADTSSLLLDLHAPLVFLNQPIASYVKELVTCSMDEPVPNAVSIISRLQTGVVTVIDESGLPVGILTRNDVLESAESGNLPADEKVSRIMRAPIPVVGITSTVNEVLRRYSVSHIRHVCVKDEQGRIFGTLSIRDIGDSHLHSYMLYLERLRHADTVAEVKHFRANLLDYIGMLIGTGTAAPVITRAVSVLSDSIVEKLLDLAIRDLGPPPAAFCFIAMGSEGRSEQTLVTDQDNAIVYADVEGPLAVEAGEYFEKLADRVCDSLNTAGYSYCKGDVMAKNPRWRQSLSAWKEYFRGWVNASSPKDLLDVNIFFDFRSAFGDARLADELRNFLFRLLSGNNAFFVYLTENALKVKPPRWQIKSGDDVDIKTALLPLTDMARIYSLKHGIRSTNTLERIARLREAGVISASGYRDLADTYDFLMRLRFRHQAIQLSENAEPSNNIHGFNLSEIEKVALRRALSLIEDFQMKLSLDFKGSL